MKRIVFLALLAAFACGDDDALDGSTDLSVAPDLSVAADADRLDGRAEDGGGEDAPSGVRDASVDGADEGIPSRCDDGVQGGNETDVDCGGACAPCGNGRSCTEPDDCRSGRCMDEVCASPEGTHADIEEVRDVAGRNPGGRSWADSFSVEGRCYCDTSFDHNIADIVVETPAGSRTVREVCEALGPGPRPLESDWPLYNDVQCGNGPPNDAGDEDDCPGRVDIGREGCGHIGPRWDFRGVDL